jgi:hypothetical protein
MLIQKNARRILPHLHRRPNPPAAMLLRWTGLAPGFENPNIKIIFQGFKIVFGNSVLLVF